MRLCKKVDYMTFNTLDNCKANIKFMLDFYIDLMSLKEVQKVSTKIEDDRNLWMQTMFSKANNFLKLLDGTDYLKDGIHINAILDTSVLFTIARSMYESLIAFDILFILPKTTDQQTILYSLFMAQGLSERLKDLDDDTKAANPQRVYSEEKDIADCRKAIEETKLFNELDGSTKNIINTAFGKQYRYLFTKENQLEKVKFEDGYKQLGLWENLFHGLYSHCSLMSHPSYLYLIQFRDQYKPDQREDINIACYASQCVVAFLSIFIIDYMKSNVAAKEYYDHLDLTRRFAIGMFEDAMRGENKFK